MNLLFQICRSNLHKYCLITISAAGVSTIGERLSAIRGGSASIEAAGLTFDIVVLVPVLGAVGGVVALSSEG